MHREREASNMRRTRHTPLTLVMGVGKIPFPETNPKVWIQLGEESHNTNAAILEIVQELKNEMAHLWVDNEMLMQEQEKIMKSLSDSQNQ